MSLDNLIGRLSKVRGKNGSYTACCPAHDDKHPSLAIRELDDGRILLKCFSGCSVSEICGAVGIDLSELFPPDDNFRQIASPIKKPFYAADLIKLLAFEAMVVGVAANSLANGNALSQIDLDRMKVAQMRIMEVVGYIND